MTIHIALQRETVAKVAPSHPILDDIVAAGKQVGYESFLFSLNFLSPTN